MNRGCVVMDIPHPSYSFNASHLTVYKTARVTRIKIMTNQISTNEKRMIDQYLQMKGVDSSSNCIRAFVRGFERSQQGFLSSQSTTEIFSAHNHTGGVHNASVMRATDVKPNG